ncbi:MAG: Cdc6/Cdc18 family protein [Nitrosopumilaceae archaeon]
MVKDAVDKLLDDAISGRSLFKDREVLQFTYIPKNILHRDDEQKKVMQSLLPLAKKSRPSNLLVYGKTGTGKTLVVRKMLQKIQGRPELQSFPLKVAYSNAKEETTLYGLLVSFGKQLGLTSRKELPPTGLSISAVFNKIIDTIKKNSFKTIFVIDEIDYLVKLVSKTDKDVFYLLTRANERLGEGSLTIIGISNDLTFKERLDPRVLSSLSEEEIVFTNYTGDQIKEILMERIKDAFTEGVIEQGSIELCARMAGQEHGDARRAIDLLRVAGEIAERENSEKVTQDHIRKASSKMEEDKETAALNSYPLHEKLLILSVMKSNGAGTGEIYHYYKNLCKTVGQKELTQRRVTQILSEIEMTGLISGKIIHQGMHGRTKKYTLTIHPETVKKVLRESAILEDII